uniref:UBX domain-containing protein n=1 Tax=Caenorhabditis tropicalis TaxID=1561998 RepID=A0A1I7TR34_9PELO
MIEGLETTFGFDILNSFGIQQPYVFSPISLLFAIALLGKDEFNSTVSEKYSEIGMKDSDVYNYLKLGDIVVKGDSGVDDPRRNVYNQTRIYFNGAWESVLRQKRLGIFYPTKTTEKAITYMKNEKHVMLSVDGTFKEFTNIDNNYTAYDLLVRTDWNVEVAIATFLEHGTDNHSAAIGYEGYQLDPVESDNFSAGGDTNGDAIGNNFGNNEPMGEMRPEDMEIQEEVPVEPLIPHMAQTETEAVLCFVNNFENRYCSDPGSDISMPLFFADTLQKAADTAFDLENGKPLLLFINNEHSTHTRLFIQFGLCNSYICDLLRNNFVMFPWDVTESSNMNRLLQMLLDSNMRPVHDYLVDFARTDRRNFPLMIVVNRRKNQIKILGTLNGTSDLNDMVNILHDGFQQFKDDLNAQIEEERKKREDRELLDRQNAEYEESLMADLRRKYEIEEDEREMKRKKEEENERVAMAASRLPEEPKIFSADTVNINFRLPENVQDTRLFYKTDRIQSLIDYLESKRFFQDEYHYLNSDFPKKKISEYYDPQKTFEEVNWPSRETVFVNPK